MPIVVDGFNLKHYICGCEDQNNSPITDVELCELLDKYLVAIRDQGEIVFDGIGPPDKSVFKRYRNLELIFSGADLEADDVIEYKIHKTSAAKNLIVVSSDRRIIRAAGEKKAIAVKCDQFWDHLQKNLAYDKRRIREPKEKQFGISEAETKQWLEIFGLEDE